MTQVTCNNTGEFTVPQVSGQACVVVTHSPLRRLLGTCLTLSRSEAILGRDTGCDLVLDVSDVSRRHARIREEAGGHVLEDLGSRSGTFVGRERVKRLTLAPGDFIAPGTPRSRPRTDDAREPIPSRAFDGGRTKARKAPRD